MPPASPCRYVVVPIDRSSNLDVAMPLKPTIHGLPVIVLAVVAHLAGGVGSPVQAEGSGLASPWIAEQVAKSRLVAGGTADASGARGLYGGVEIVLGEGWKTYWRNPGSSGVPPSVDWAGSTNLASVELVFPAPRRFVEKEGDAIGYKHHVVLPFKVIAKDPAQPVILTVAAEFGVCREVCIPFQPKYRLELPANATAIPAAEALQSAVRSVPLNDAGRPGDPKLQKVALNLAAAKPTIAIDAVFPGDVEKSDVFLEAPEGLWIPMPRPTGPAKGNSRRFEVDLTQGADLSDLKGRMIRLTLVGSEGQSETTFKFE